MTLRCYIFKKSQENWKDILQQNIKTLMKSILLVHIVGLKSFNSYKKILDASKIFLWKELN